MTNNVSLHHVHLAVDEVEVFCEFFEKYFSAKVVFDQTIDGDRNVFLCIGSGRIHLFESRHPPAQDRNIFHHIGFLVENLPSFVEELRAAGLEVSEITAVPGGGFAMAQGPNGLLMELFTVTEESREFFID